jgi:hypothetical protein
MAISAVLARAMSCIKYQRNRAALRSEARPDDGSAVTLELVDRPA